MAVLRVIAHGQDAADAMSLHDLRAAHDVVAGEGGLGIEVALYGGLAAYRLTRQRRLVHL